MTVERAMVFAAVPDALVVLDLDLVVRDANPAYLDGVGATLEDVVGRPVGDLLDAREDDPGAGGRMLAGYAEVLRTGRVTGLGVARYDVEDPAAPGTLVTRFWSVEVSPLRDDGGTLVGLVHRARDVTAVHEQLLRALDLHRGLDGEDTGSALVDLTAQSVHTSQVAAALAVEVAQLREAMASRAGIEQAKGILMGQRGIGPDEAFALLATLSQDSNRKLRDVAAVVVGSVLEGGARSVSPGAAAHQRGA